MRTVKLGAVVDINPRDRRPPSAEPVSFVGMAELDADRGIARPRESRAYSDVAKGYTAFRDRDLLVAKITPCWENGKIGQARLDHEWGAGSTEFHVLRPSAEVDDRYLLGFLRQPWLRPEGERRMTGSGGQRRVPASFLGDLEIRLPDIYEQRRIAAILDAADEIHAKRRAQLAHLDELPQALFHEIFDSRGVRERVALKDAIKWASGKFLPAKAQALGPYPVYGGNGISGNHDEYMFEDARLVVGRVGAYCGAVHVTRPKSWITDNALVATLLTDELTLDFLLPALTTANLNQYAATSGQPSISAGRIADVQIPLPPLSLQQEFAAKVEAIHAERGRVARALEADDELFAALQHRAFRGEL